MPQTRIILPQTDIGANATSFRRHPRAENFSPKTAKTCGEAIDQFADFLRERGMPGRLAHIHREHVESFIEHLPGAMAPRLRRRPATADCGGFSARGRCGIVPGIR